VDEHEERRRPLVRDLAEVRKRLSTMEQQTEAHQREHERLRDRLELFRQLVENSQGLVCSHDLEGNLLYVSPASAWELGYTPADGVGRNLREFLAPSVRPFFDGYLARIREKEADRGLLRLVSRDGEERLWAYRNALFHLPDREPYVIGHAVDITERIHVESLLRDSEERYRTVIEGLEEGVLFKSAAGAISDWNPSAQRILGSALERLGADAIKDDGSPFAPEEQPDALALRSGLPSPRVVMGIPREIGEPTWISVRAHPLIRSGEIAPHGVVMSFVDVSERRRRRTLSGILSICASCKKIRDEEGNWWPVEIYVRDHSEAEFSHGLCAECARHLRQQFRLME
jgi:two-component system sensor histidine kinase VicK